MAGYRRLALFLLLGITTPLACVPTDFSSSSGKVAKKAPEKEQNAEAKPVNDDKDKDRGKDDSDDIGDTDAGVPIDPVVPVETKADNAVTKGSFTAWAVPPNPQPRESYWIHIEVKLPPNTQNYSQMDLAGTVVGTDLYQRGIGRESKGSSGPGGAFADEHPDTFAVNGDKATVAVWVPGAESLVRDTVKIRSDLLNEEQSLEIVFQ